MHDILHAIVDAIRTADENAKRRLHDMINQGAATTTPAPAAADPAPGLSALEQAVADLKARIADLERQLADARTVPAATFQPPTSSAATGNVRVVPQEVTPDAAPQA